MISSVCVAGARLTLSRVAQVLRESQITVIIAATDVCEYSTAQVVLAVQRDRSEIRSVGVGVDVTLLELQILL